MNILSLSGFVPEQICDTVRFFGYDGRQRISHYCQYVADFISQVLEDDGVDGAVFPRSCDSSRTVGSYLEGCGKFMHQIHVPARRDAAAVSYLAGELRRYKDAVEGHYGVELADARERTGLVNERNRALGRLYGHLPELSYTAYLDMLHSLLQMPLREQQVPEDLPACAHPEGARVFLVGSTQGGVGAIRQIEGAGLRVVGDRLPESHRLLSAPEVPAEGDVFEGIAASMLSAMPSPTQNAFAEAIGEDREEIMKKQVQGVIFLTQKYCEPYDYLFPAYKAMLDDLGVPVVRVTASGGHAEGAPLAIGTFAGML